MTKEVLKNISFFEEMHFPRSKRGWIEAFDYAFIAPPQYKGMWKEMLLSIDG